MSCTRARHGQSATKGRISRSTDLDSKHTIYGKARVLTEAELEQLSRANISYGDGGGRGVIRDIGGRLEVEVEVEVEVEPEVDIIILIIKEEEGRKEDKSKLGVDLLYYLRPIIDLKLLLPDLPLDIYQTTKLIVIFITTTQIATY